MEENCPECGNEIYKPYKYCNACSWEKEEEKPKKDAKSKKPHPDKKSKKEYEGKPKKPMKIKCKCGESITIKSSKRPIKIECPSCGRKGTIKAPAKTKEMEPTKPAKSEPSKERVGGKPSKRRARDFQREQDRRSEHETEEPLRRRGPKSKKKERKSLEPEDLVEKYCPECDTRLSVTGSCPNCGYRGRGKGRGVEFIGEPWADNEGASSLKYQPPEDTQAVKPRKGICSQCGSNSLRFFDDGSGRCGSCGRHFRWDGGPSKVQDDAYMCNNCGEQLKYINEYERWYCHECDEYK
jgi:hypothetical protein